MEKGLIIKSTGSFYSVKNSKNEIVTCKVRGKLRIKGIKSIETTEKLQRSSRAIQTTKARFP